MHDTRLSPSPARVWGPLAPPSDSAHPTGAQKTEAPGCWAPPPLHSDDQGLKFTWR